MTTAMKTAMTTIAIAGGSSVEGPEAYVREARSFGRAVARQGWILRTGGGSGRSVMGAATDGALKEGGRVDGVILKQFWKDRHRGIRRMTSCSTFPSRKKELFRSVAAVVAFPGGYGTLDELFELLTLKQTGSIVYPVVLVDVGGSYGGLLAWERRADRERLLYGGRLLQICKTGASAVRVLKLALAPSRIM